MKSRKRLLQSCSLKKWKHIYSHHSRCWTSYQHPAEKNSMSFLQAPFCWNSILQDLQWLFFCMTFTLHDDRAQILQEPRRSPAALLWTDHVNSEGIHPAGISFSISSIQPSKGINSAHAWTLRLYIYQQVYYILYIYSNKGSNQLLNKSSSTIVVSFSF